MIKNSLVALLCFFLSLSAISAQITKGSIKMAITDFKMPQMESEGTDMMAGMESMMKSMEMTIHFKPGKQVTDINMMGMINMNQHYNNGVMTQYMDMMGQKIKMEVPMGEAGLEEFGMDAETLKNMYSVSYDKSDTREVLGYKCHKATFDYDMSKIMGEQEDLPAEAKAMMENMKMVMYVTDEIKMDQFHIQQLPDLTMEGTPLLWIMDMGQMKMTFEAVDFDQHPDASVFEAPSGDYKEMSVEEMKQMGMKPGGFGF